MFKHTQTGNHINLVANSGKCAFRLANNATLSRAPERVHSTIQSEISVDMCGGLFEPGAVFALPIYGHSVGVCSVCAHFAKRKPPPPSTSIGGSVGRRKMRSSARGAAYFGACRQRCALILCGAITHAHKYRCGNNTIYIYDVGLECECEHQHHTNTKCSLASCFFFVSRRSREIGRNAHSEQQQQQSVFCARVWP